MSPSSVQQRKKHAHSVSVPIWYYAVLGAVAVLGILLIIFISPNAGLFGSASGPAEGGDYYLGNKDAPVTVIEWGSPT